MYPMNLTNCEVLLIGNLVCPIPSDSARRRINTLSNVPMVCRIATNVAREIDVLESIRQVLRLMLTLCNSLGPNSEEVLIEARVRSVVVALVLG